MDERVRNLPSIVCRSAGGESFLIRLAQIQKTILKNRLGDQTERRRAILKRLTRKIENSYKKMEMDYPPFSDLFAQQGSTSQLLPEGFHLADPEVVIRLNKTIQWIKRAKRNLDATAQTNDAELISIDRDIDQQEDTVDESHCSETESPKSDRILDETHMPRRDVDRTSLSSISVDVPHPESSNKNPEQEIRMQSNDEGISRIDKGDVQGAVPFVEDKDLEVSGTDLYAARCQNLYLVPLSRVIKGLASQSCTLDHARIARDGADALSKALSVNNIISHLSLVDCALDSQSIRYLVHGLGTFADSDPGDGPPGDTKGSCLMKKGHRLIKQGGFDRQKRKRSSIVCLRLSENALGAASGHCLAQLLDPNNTMMQPLSELSLFKTCLTDEGALALIKSLRNGNRSLKKLNFSSNDIGNKTCSEIGNLLESNHTLTDLDLSWNSIKAAGAGSLAKGLTNNGALRHLDLSWNGLENEGAIQLGEMLSINLSLKSLNLTNTRAGTEGCLVLAEGLKTNHTLEWMSLDGNPIGEYGARHLMHAVRHNDTLKFLGLKVRPPKTYLIKWGGLPAIQSTNMSASVADGESESAKFNPLFPDGSYKLDLSKQTDRTVALQLCQLDGATSLNHLRNARLNGKDIQPADMDWPDRLPTHGMLSLEYVSRSTRKTVPVIDSQKINAIVAQFAHSSMTDFERLGIVHVSAPYHLYRCEQIRLILECFSVGEERLEAAMMLFTRAVDADKHLDVMLQLLHEIERRQFTTAVGHYVTYAFSNPTGHYELNLSIPFHRMIAARLKDCAHGAESGPVWKNIVYDTNLGQLKIHSNHGPPEQWKTLIPTVGTLSMDYVSKETTPIEARPLSDASIVQFMKEKVGVEFNEAENCPVYAVSCDAGDAQVTELRRGITNRFLTCEGLRKILQFFKRGPHRVEAVVCCFARIIDRENFWSVLSDLRCLEQGILVSRLTPVTCHFSHHTSMHWILDVANPEHSDIAKKLIKAALSDGELPNLWNIRLNGKKRQLTENKNLWAVITTDTLTPLLEFDFIGNDTWSTVFEFPPDRLKGMTVGEKLEHRRRYAARLESLRLWQTDGYFHRNSGFHVEEWQTRAGLFKPLLGKSPWVAAWDGILRQLMRLGIQNGEMQKASPLEVLYQENADQRGRISDAHLTEFLDSMGFSQEDLDRSLAVVETEHTSDNHIITFDATKTVPSTIQACDVDFPDFMRLFTHLVQEF